MKRFYIAIANGLTIVKDGPGGLQMDVQLQGVETTCVAIDAANPRRVYCGSAQQGLMRSEDAGDTWHPVGAGIPSRHISAVAVGKDETVWAGTEPTALFRSHNGGATWDECETLKTLPSAPTWSYPPRPHTSHVRWIEPDPLENGRLFVAIEQGGVMRSLDNGATWEDRTPTGPRDAHTLATHAYAPNRVYAAAGDGFMAPGRGYAESQDGGLHWEPFGEGLAHHYLWGIAVDSADPDTVLISCAEGPQQAHNPMAANARLYRKTKGETWQECREGLPDPPGTNIYYLAADPLLPAVFYAATGKGLFQTTNAGQTWTSVGGAWPDYYKMQHVQALAVTDAA